MWTVLITIIVGVMLVGLAVFLVIYNHKKEKERTLALQQTAAVLGWSFAATAPMTMIGGLDRVSLFAQGHSKRIKNFMCGEAEGVKGRGF